MSASGLLQPALPLVLLHFPRDLQSTSPAALPDSLSYLVLGIQSPPKYELGIQSHPHFGFEVPYLIFVKAGAANGWNILHSKKNRSSWRKHPQPQRQIEF